LIFSKLKLADILVEIKNVIKPSPHRDHILDFIETSKRGIARA
jgi:hypothetical protein